MKANHFPSSNEANSLAQILQKHQNTFHPVMKEVTSELSVCRIDLSGKNDDLKEINFQNTEELNHYIFGLIEKEHALAAIGGYLEKRIFYSRSTVFEGEKNRSIHLGVDIWAKAFTPIFASLEGKIHSFQDNNSYGDYGPTIILEHFLEGIQFYTLYGHLSRRSLNNLQQDKFIPKGASFTELGPFPENGDWPPHLHFQIILDLQGRKGDFPGVAAPSEMEKYQAICPDPKLILNHAFN